MEMGPYLAGDVNTETVWVQRVIRFSYAYVSTFLSNKVTPGFQFETLYPQILTDNRAVDCTTLHCFFQMALTVPVNGTPSVLNRLPFLPTTRNPIIHSMHKRIHHFHLPILSNTQAQSIQNATADQFGLLVSQQQQYRQIVDEKKMDDCLTTVEKWLGLQRFTPLLKLCGVASEGNLNPIWKVMASEKNSEQVTMLQATFDYYNDQLNYPHITFAADLFPLATTFSLVWTMSTLDSIGTIIQFF